MVLPVLQAQAEPGRRIEQEHYEILKLANRLRTGLDAGSSKGEIEEVLSEMLSRVRRHFESEERLMTACSYPECARHTEEHRKLLEQLESVSREVAAGAIGRSGVLGLFVERWIEQHIQGSDSRFLAHLRESGTSLES